MGDDSPFYDNSPQPEFFPRYDPRLSYRRPMVVQQGVDPEAVLKMKKDYEEIIARMDKQFKRAIAQRDSVIAKSNALITTLGELADSLGVPREDIRPKIAEQIRLEREKLGLPKEDKV